MKMNISYLCLHKIFKHKLPLFIKKLILTPFPLPMIVCTISHGDTAFVSTSIIYMHFSFRHSVWKRCFHWGPSLPSGIFRDSGDSIVCVLACQCHFQIISSWLSSLTNIWTADLVPLTLFNYSECLFSCITLSKCIYEIVESFSLHRPWNSSVDVNISWVFKLPQIP